MARAVVCTRTDGPDRHDRRRRDRVYVPPGDAAALRRAIVELLDDPVAARARRTGARVGRGARHRRPLRCWARGGGGRGGVASATG